MMRLLSLDYATCIKTSTSFILMLNFISTGKSCVLKGNRANPKRLQFQSIHILKFLIINIFTFHFIFYEL